MKFVILSEARSADSKNPEEAHSTTTVPPLQTRPVCPEATRKIRYFFQFCVSIMERP
jgi:hypothetical protein